MYPEICKIGFLTIYSYGFMVALGFISGIYIAAYIGRKKGINKDKIFDIGMYVFLAGIIGARLLYVIINLKYYIGDPIAVFKIWEGGVVYYGGLLTAILAFFWLTRKEKEGFWQYADIFAPGLVIGQALGRIGCFLNGCCYGVRSDSFGCVFSKAGPVPYFPIQLVESAGAFLIFSVLFFGKKKYEGQVFLKYLLFYGILRFVLEFFRGDDRGPKLFNALSISQFGSLAIIIIASYFMLKARKSANKKV